MIIYTTGHSRYGVKGTRTVPQMHLLRTKSVVSSLRGTSDRRTYGASTSQMRLGYVADL